MTNIYIENAKNIMRDFFLTEKSRIEQIKTNNGYYSDELAKSKNAELNNLSENDYLDRINTINNIFKDVKRKIALVAFPNADDITEDERLFNGTFPLTQKEIETFIDKYSTNQTMLRIIKKYIDDNYIENPTLHAFYTNRIPSTDKLLDSYKRIFQSIINTMGAIHRNPTGAPENVIDTFTPDLSIIGNGEYLYNYIPKTETYDTTYDDIVLIREYANTFEELK